MVVVYFEYCGHAHIEAIFNDEELYAVCIKPLEEKAKEFKATLTESIITDPDEAQQLLFDFKIKQAKNLEREN